MPAAPFPAERLHANDDDDDDDDRPAFIQRALLPDESSSEDEELEFEYVVPDDPWDKVLDEASGQHYYWYVISLLMF